MAEDETEAWAIISRFGEHSMVQEFVPLAARYTALRDMANRQRTDRLRQGSAAEDNGVAGAAGE